MSHIKNKLKSQTASVGGLASAIRQNVLNAGAGLATREQSNLVVAGLESLDANQAHLFTQHMHNVQGVLTQAAEEIGLNINVDGPGMEAASIVLGAAGNLHGYAQIAAGSQAAAGNNIALGATMFGTNASAMGYEDVASMEAFDETTLNEMLGYSASFNLFAAQQDPFGEAFFKTVVLTGELGGIDVTVPRLRVFNKAVHAASGKVLDWQAKSVIDAYVDPSILADNSTDLVPVKAADGSANASFVPASAVAVRSVQVAGVAVPTAPLLAGKKHDLIGLSQYQPLIGMNAMDINDAVDKSVKLKSIYVVPAAGKAAIRVSTAGMPQAQFVKGPEGNYRQMILALDTLISIGDDVKAVDGTAVTEFAALVSNGYRAVVSLQVNGGLNVQTGTISVHGMPLSLDGLYEADGTVADTASGTGKTIKDAIEAATVVGYEIAGKRTNSNRRTVGLRVDSSLETNRFPIPVSSPISIQAPHSSNNDAADLKALITIARIRNSNNAITALIGAEEYLEEHVSENLTQDEIYAKMPGMGRFLVRPFFERKTLDLDASINSISSHEKAADTSAVIVNALRDVVYRMFQASRFQAAVDALTGGAGDVPTLVLGMDQVIIQHVMVPGDTRTLGTLFPKVKIVQTLDQRVKGKIYATFVREDVEGCDPLSFGTHAWIPELVTTVPAVSREGAQIKETQVQTRTLHFVNLPVLAVIEIQNLSKVLGDKISAPALDTDLSNPFLAGHTYP